MSQIKALEEAYQQLNQSNKPANFLTNCGSVGDAAAFGAIYYFLEDRGISLHGIIENPYPVSQSERFNSAAMGVLNPSDYLVVPNTRDAKSFLGKVANDLIESSRVRKRCEARPSVPNDIDIADLNDPFFIIQTYDSMVSVEAIRFALTLERPIVYVLLDDGVAYKTRNPLEIYLMAPQRVQNPIVRFFHLSFAKLAYKRLSKMVEAFERSSVCLTFTLFKRCGTDFTLNPKVKEYLSRSYREFRPANENARRDYSNTALLIATKAEVYGLEDIELEMMRMTIDRLSAHDIDAIVKPHPLTTDIERYRSLGVPIDEASGMSLEAELATCLEPPIATIGLISTGQIYGNILFDIPNLSYYDIAKEKIEEVSHRVQGAAQFADSSNRIRSAYSENIEIVGSPQELEEAINRAIRRAQLSRD